MKVHGSCLCQGVRYEIDGPVGQAAYCHCSRCRKWSGTAFTSYAGVAKQDFSPALHIWVGSKAPWFAITDDLPQRVELRA